MVIVIRGACSVGKTAVSRALVHALPMSAHVDCDTMMPWMSDATLETLRSRGEGEVSGLINDWLARTAEASHQRGVRAIVDWHFPTDADLKNLLEQLDKKHVPHRVFNLSCSAEEHLLRDQQRDEEAQIGQGGIEYFSREGSWVGSPHGQEIDTTGLTPENVAKAIAARITA